MNRDRKIAIVIAFLLVVYYGCDKLTDKAIEYNQTHIQP